MKHNIRKAKLGKKLENPRMEARARKFRKGDLVRLAPRADRGSDSVYEWLKDRVGVVTNVHPYNWDVIVNFGFNVTNALPTFNKHYIRDFGFWDFDLELVKRS